MFVNLYTDSLKKGTFNYINVDGLLSSGKYIPLDSNHLIFTSSAGRFFGNSLWLDKDCSAEKVIIRLKRRDDPSQAREFTMYIKKKEDNDLLLTEEELLRTKKTKKKDR
jgi:hypothetical protein